MANDQGGSGAKPPFQALFVTSSFTLDLEVSPEFMQNVVIGLAGMSEKGNPIIRLAVANPSDKRKLCINVPQGTGSSIPHDDCPDPKKGGIELLVDQPTKGPWRFRLGRTKP